MKLRCTLRETPLACPRCGYSGPHLGTPVHPLIACRCGAHNALSELVPAKVAA